MPTSVRLDPETETMVHRLARKEGVTKSAIIRKAIRRYAASEKAARPRTPYEAMAHLIGSVRGAPKDLSERTGEKFYELLLEGRRRR